MSEKVLGYVLLAIGILVMFFAVGYIWLVFTNKIAAVEVIEAKSLKLDFAQALSDLPSGQSINSSTGGMEIFSGQDMSKTINLSITFFLMTFVMLFGFRIASLGVMLMRPIVVRMKEANETAHKSLPSQNVTGSSS